MKFIDFPFEAIEQITFSPKPHPLPANLRPVYRIALMIIVLKINCKNNTASLLKLQFFNWIIKNSSLQNFVLNEVSFQSPFTLDFIHIDPMVNLALTYAYADDLITISNNSKYKLTPRGEFFAKQIIQDKGDTTLRDEQIFLKHIGTKISEIQLKEKML